MIKLPKNSLHQTIVFCAGLLDSKAEGPYSFLQVEVKNKKVEVIGVSSMCCSKIRFGIETNDEFSFISKGDKLDDIIGSIDSNDVYIDLTDVLIFKGEKIQITAPIENATLPREIECENLRLIAEKTDIKALASALRFVSKSSYDGPSDAMSSNLFIDTNEIRACDDTRLYCVDYRLGVSLSIPKRNANIIYGFAELVPYCNIYVNETTVKFMGENGELTILKGTAPILPTFQEMLPNYLNKEDHYFNRENLILAIKRAALTSDRKYPEICFKSINNSLFLLSSKDGYSTQILIKEKIINKILSRTNPKFWIDYLSSLSTESVICKFGTELDPIYLNSFGYKALLMPHSVSDEADEFDQDFPSENYIDDDIPF